MKLLLLGDTHVRGFGHYLSALTRSVTCMEVSVGRPMNFIKEKYTMLLLDIRDFEPDVVIIMMGHNDIVPSYRTHVTLMDPDVMQDNLISFALEVHHSFPATEVLIANMLPHIPTSKFSMVLALAYSQMVIRAGARLTKLCRENDFNVVYNDVAWKLTKPKQALASLFCSDGLHLNHSGKEAMAREWTHVLHQVLQ